MLENDIIMPRAVQPPRDEKLLKKVTPIVDWIVDHTTTLHINMPKDILEMYKFRAQLGAGVMTVQNHLGIPETYILPDIFYKYDLPIPYSISGDNLIKGKFFVDGATKLGIIFSERGTFDVEVAARRSREKTESVLERGCNIDFWPVPGRSKNGLTIAFQSSPFQTALKLDTPIFPTAVTYFELPEEYHFIEKKRSRRNLSKTEKLKGYTIKILHIPKLIFKHKGDVYFNFGEPIIPSQLFGWPIPEEKIPEYSILLADHARKACLNQTAITERNIVAFAAGMPGYIRDNVEIVLDKLQSHSDKFVFKFSGDCNFGDISLEDKISILIHRAELSGKHPKLIKMYGNQIKHYVEGMYGRNYDK